MDEIIEPVAVRAATRARPRHGAFGGAAPRLSDRRLGLHLPRLFRARQGPKAERFQRKSDGMATEVVMHFSNMLDK